MVCLYKPALDVLLEIAKTGTDGARLTDHRHKRIKFGFFSLVNLTLLPYVERILLSEYCCPP